MFGRFLLASNLILESSILFVTMSVSLLLAFQKGREPEYSCGLMYMLTAFGHIFLNASWKVWLMVSIYLFLHFANMLIQARIRQDKWARVKSIMLSNAFVAIMSIHYFILLH